MKFGLLCLFAIIIAMASASSVLKRISSLNTRSNLYTTEDTDTFEHWISDVKVIDNTIPIFALGEKIQVEFTLDPERVTTSSFSYQIDLFTVDDNNTMTTYASSTRWTGVKTETTKSNSFVFNSANNPVAKFSVAVRYYTIDDQTASSQVVFATGTFAYVSYKWSTPTDCSTLPVCGQSTATESARCLIDQPAGMEDQVSHYNNASAELKETFCPSASKPTDTSLTCVSKTSCDKGTCNTSGSSNFCKCDFGYTNTLCNEQDPTAGGDWISDIALEQDPTEPWPSTKVFGVNQKLGKLTFLYYPANLPSGQNSLDVEIKLGGSDETSGRTAGISIAPGMDDAIPGQVDLSILADSKPGKRTQLTLSYPITPSRTLFHKKTYQLEFTIATYEWKSSDDDTCTTAETPLCGETKVSREAMCAVTAPAEAVGDVENYNKATDGLKEKLCSNGSKPANVELSCPATTTCANGTCEVGETANTCKCATGWTGDLCQTEDKKDDGKTPPDDEKDEEDQDNVEEPSNSTFTLSVGFFGVVVAVFSMIY